MSAVPGGSGYPLDPSAADMRAMGQAVVETLITWIEGLDDAPAENTEGALQIAQKLAAEPPEHGEPDVRGLIDDAIEAASHTYEYSGPGYLAYIPGGGLYTAALAEFLAQGLNRYVGLWQPSPAMVQLEENVTRWLCSLFDFPEGSQGLLTTGGSMGTLAAMVTARHTRLGEDFTDGVYYCTDQTHASVTKNATIAGFSRRNLRIVPTDAELRMDPDALRDAVRADRAAGLRPFLVSPAAGTTNTGAVDPLDAVADVARGRRPVAPRRRRLRRLLPADRPRPRALPRHRARRQRDARPAQRAVPAVRDRRRRRSATARRCATPTTRARRTSRTCRPRATSRTTTSTRPSSRGTCAASACGSRWCCTASTRSGPRSTRSSTSPTGCTRRSRTTRTSRSAGVPQLTVVPFRMRGGDEAASRELLARINASKRVFLSSTMIRDDVLDPRVHRVAPHARRPDRRVRGDRARGRRRDRRLRRPCPSSPRSVRCPSGWTRSSPAPPSSAPTSCSSRR